MRPFRLAVFAVLISVVAPSCGDEGKSPASKVPDLIRPLPPSTVGCGGGSAELRGRFLAPNGLTPIVGARVTVDSSDCVASTDETGAFLLKELPAAPVTVQVSKGIFNVEGTANPGEELALQIDPADFRLAYVSGVYDSIEVILEQLGFSPVEIPVSELGAADLSQYDALFFNCGMAVLGEYFEGGMANELRAFVSGGGSLYASDWADRNISEVFPGRITFLAMEEGTGVESEVVARVHDETLRRALGKETAEIHFDLPGWTVIESVASGTDILVSGPVSYLYFDFDDFEAETRTETKPLVVQFKEGKGKVTYTSFHNEAQNTKDVDVLLGQIVFNL